MEPRLIAVMGPTGVGKSEIAEWLADRLEAQLINADAFMVYRGLDVGTNKPRDKERYLLLDLKDPCEEIGVGEWVGLAIEELRRLYAEGRSAIVVGGTGLYVRALFEEWSNLYPPPDPDLRMALEEELREKGLEALADRLGRFAPDVARKTDLRNPVRVRRALEIVLGGARPLSFVLPEFRKWKVGLDLPVPVLDERLDRRTVKLLATGWLEEVQSLAERGVNAECAAMRAIGYRTLLSVVGGERGLEEVEPSIQLETRRYAKRQRTWMRTEPRLEMFSALDMERLREGVSDRLSALM
ncbi:MAG TPA: tRNA (adenosine(37)-N6)-dimethylallyltransferase MiaA [Fimbriimonadaceae bacterium]|nr:tRNA (adenosine(37)-N6)-dimethylallyltransferase MiaA [Fimbriimonadaceae bacterium]HRJ96772.1 tRNA (adenosine(37)-N6)-dimethylallyltransferase MiaA [Fimbriimonadaceae bacterium]